MMEPLLLTPSDFVALLNQTLEFAYPNVVIEGELANLRVSKGKWVYFDLKDEFSSIKFFGTVFNLPGPLETGMTLRVTGVPRLHAQYGFSVTVQAIALAGEGTIKKAFDLLLEKLTKEGLFEPGRKRELPYPPQHIGLITSSESAAYADFVKIVGKRWGGLNIELADVQVQGEPAAGQIVRAIEYFNAQGTPPEALILIRGGGSADDLQTFNTEAVPRAVAASRIPTLVAIGHEIDTSLAELAADVRGSTPSNAAELLVPDKAQVLREIGTMRLDLGRLLSNAFGASKKNLALSHEGLSGALLRVLNHQRDELVHAKDVLGLLSPTNILKRGYSVVRKNGQIVRSSKQIESGDELELLLMEGAVKATAK